VGDGGASASTRRAGVPSGEQTVESILRTSGAVHTHKHTNVIGGASLEQLAGKAGGGQLGGDGWQAKLPRSKATSAVNPEPISAAEMADETAAPPVSSEAVAAGGGADDANGAESGFVMDEAPGGPKRRADGDDAAAAAPRTTTRKVPRHAQGDSVAAQARCDESDGQWPPSPPTSVDECLAGCRTLDEWQSRLSDASDPAVAWRALYVCDHLGLGAELAAAVNGLPRE